MIQKKISLQLQTALGLIIAILCLALIFSAQGWRLFVVQTPSMGWTAPVGSLVVSQTQETYKPGDIISFYRNSRIYTHRIVDVKVITLSTMLAGWPWLCLGYFLAG